MPRSTRWQNPSDFSIQPEGIVKTTSNQALGDACHVPVLLQEILEFFQPEPRMCIIDGTLGFGGHSERFLQAGARVIGVDQDPEALERAIERLSGFGHQFQGIRGNAASLDSLAKSYEAFPQQVDAMLFDLGVSSWQLDQAERGFSFQEDGPLDMRMDPDQTTTAADLVNQLSEEALADVLDIARGSTVTTSPPTSRSLACVGPCVDSYAGSASPTSRAGRPRLVRAQPQHAICRARR